MRSVAVVKRGVCAGAGGGVVGIRASSVRQASARSYGHSVNVVSKVASVFCQVVLAMTSGGRIDLMGIYAVRSP